MDPVPDALLFRKSGSAGNQTRTTGSVARDYNHYTTEAVHGVNMKRKKCEIPLLPLYSLQ
jgi:hypothetical protein